MKQQAEQQGGHKEIQAADPGARNRALMLVGAAILVGVVLLVLDLFYEVQAEAMLRAAALHFLDRPGLMFLALLALVTPMIAASVYIFIQAGRIIHAQRMPYPGQKVIRDTVVISGEEAVKRGRGLQFLAVFMTLFSLMVPFIPLIMMYYFKQVS